MKFETPFDNLALSLSSSLNHLHLHRKQSDFEKMVSKQLSILRSIFISMIQNKLDHEFLSEKEVPRNITLMEGLDEDCVSLYGKLNYFAFIHQLNQLGKIYKKYKYMNNKDTENVIPDYRKIVLFRNKVMEHWDDYCEIQSVGLISIDKKIFIPSFRGAPATTEVLTERMNFLDEEFKRYSGGVSFFDEKFDGSMYSALSAIDDNLLFYPQNGHQGLFELLFKHGFETPIKDIEDYSQKLANSITGEFSEELKEIAELTNKIQKQ